MRVWGQLKLAGQPASIENLLNDSVYAIVYRYVVVGSM